MKLILTKSQMNLCWGDKMVMNKQKGNMYSFVTHTWNVIKGKCPHDCVYCYMKKFPQGKLRFDESELKTNLGEGNFIFVGSSCDMFADGVTFTFKVEKILEHCKKYPKNTYLFQTKNPVMFHKYKNDLPKNCILGTTIESNRKTPSKAPTTEERVGWMEDETLFGTRKFVTIEPIMDFDVPYLIDMIKKIRPEFVNIGADTTGNNLEEPSYYKLQLLIHGLEKFTKVNLKDNLKRLLIKDL